MIDLSMPSAAIVALLAWLAFVGFTIDFVRGSGAPGPLQACAAAGAAR